MNNYTIYFHEINNYKLSVSKKGYEKFNIGDRIELKVVKGRVSGYYLLSHEVEEKTNSY